MKACVLENLGKLQYKDVEIPQLEEDEVLLRIDACGICSSDIGRVYKNGTYHYPIILGHEFAGQIVDVGRSVEKQYLGKKAVVFPLKPCFRCSSCKEQQYARCDDYDYYGSRCNGAFAEYLAVKKWNLFFYEGISALEAAMCEPAAVALHAVKGHVKKGDIALIIGTGTIGYLVAMWCDILGATDVIIVGRNENKLYYAQTLGIRGLKTLKGNGNLNYLCELDALTSGQMPNIVVECVGSNEALDTAIKSARKGGKIIVVGNPEGQVNLDKEVYWKILRNELTIVGRWNSEVGEQENNWMDVLKNMIDGKLNVNKLITHVFALKDYQAAFDTICDKSEFSVKVMLKNEKENEK